MVGKMNKKHLKNKKGFALIYVLLFITLLLTAASATWVTGMADLRLSQRSSNSVQASELAKSAINEGFVDYKLRIGTGALTPVTYPPNACVGVVNGVGSTVVRTDLNPVATSTPSLKQALTLTQTANGIYDYRICPSGASTIIEGIGYYKGSKVTLSAVVTHANNECTTVPDLITGTTITTCDHTNDYLTITQTGPSQ